MNYLIDTCVISELTKKKPEKNVETWLRRQNELSLFLSVITFGELQKGIAKLDLGPRKTELQQWVDIDLRKRFHGRILPFDYEAATKWGVISGELERMGTPIPVLDGQIAASALLHGMIIVSRNEKHLTPTGVTVHNPWNGCLS